MTAILRYDVACQAIAAAKAIDDVKDIRDRAEALRHYAHQAKNRTLELDAVEIRMRAERRLGEMLSQAKAGGTIREGRPPKGATRTTLRRAGIARNLSMRAQRLAAVPSQKFEADIVRWREASSVPRGRVTPGLPNEPDIVVIRKKPPQRSPYVIGGIDIRRWSIAELRLVITGMSAVLEHVGGADDSATVTECINDDKLALLLSRRS